jgi:regulator of protease activity HflC (stomatin/prohibitin superfamily)
MRIDHYTYQKASTTAVTGLLLQLAIATTLLVFGLVAGSSAFVFASLYVAIGCLLWIGLIVLFYQQKMQTLEELEETELAGVTGSSMFDSGTDQIRPAANRLRLLHKWIMPALSFFIAISLIVIGFLIVKFLGRTEHPDDLQQTVILQSQYIGWALAVAMGFALVSFIYSRFVAGMANIPAWTNLRGGSAWMVGNTIVLLALSVGLLFRFFDNDQVLLAVCWGIPIFMFAVAGEIVVNFILNLYRPRLHGESPRPAFDSKTLSMFASPDSLVRSINEAINYQFGFDITSSWGYQLMLRSAAWLLVLGVVVLLAMSSMIVVEPTQQAVRVRQGALISDVYHPGVMFKLPWPIERADIYDVTRIRELDVTFKWKEERNVILWTDDYNKNAVVMPKPFIVNETMEDSDVSKEDVLSLIDVRAVLKYRIAQGGLLDWIQFGSEDVDRRSRLTQREMTLLAFSQNTLTTLFQNLSLNDIIGDDRGNISSIARTKLQASLDAQDSGVEIIAVDLPLVAPARGASGSFEELSVAIQGEELLVTTASGNAQSILTSTAGDPKLVDSIIQAVANYNIARTTWDNLRRSKDSDAGAIAKAKAQLDSLEIIAVDFINSGNGRAAATIRNARVAKWTAWMTTWANASRVSGQAAAYSAAPNLYKQRMYMSVLARKLPAIRKYVIGINPERLNLDVELKSINPLLNFADALEFDEEGN